MPVAWRLTSLRRAASAFSGDGSVAHPGRWHHPGTRCIYVSSSLSLAQLEVMVHSGGGRPAIQFVAFRVLIPDDLAIADVPAVLLSEGWRTFPAPTSLADFGSNWVLSGATAVLRIPSAVSPRESNFLLNPSHSDYARIVFSGPENFEFDDRLLVGIS